MKQIEIDVFREIEILPSPPFQITRVLNQVNTMSFKDFRAETMIQNDPAITCQILKIANAPFYGYPSQIVSLQQASNLLGPGPIKNIILTTPILENSNGVFEDYDIAVKSLWRHMIITATFALEIAELSQSYASDECFTAGLIHDIGKIALLVYQPKIFSIISKKAKREKVSLSQAGNEVLGWPISEISGNLASIWGFPKKLINAVKLNHNLESDNYESRKLSALVYLSDCLANNLDYHDGWHTLETPIEKWIFETLELDQSTFNSWIPRLKEFAELAVVAFED
jgi:HD-like signal output (HDOD) protein